MATKKAKDATANFDASGYVSENVFSGKRILQGAEAEAARERAAKAQKKAKKKLHAEA
jgi:hypothetical protein